MYKRISSLGAMIGKKAKNMQSNLAFFIKCLLCFKVFVQPFTHLYHNPLRLGDNFCPGLKVFFLKCNYGKVALNVQITLVS